MLDINLFRTDGEHDGKPELIRESQLKRFAPVKAVDEVRALDLAWRQGQLKLENTRKELNANSKRIGALRAAKQDAEAQELAARTAAEIKRALPAAEAEVREIEAALHAKLIAIGNIVQESVVVSDDEANNAVVRLWPETPMWSEEKEFLKKNHVDIYVTLDDMVDLKRGARLAGGWGFFLRTAGVLLNQALITRCISRGGGDWRSCSLPVIFR